MSHVEKKNAGWGMAIAALGVVFGDIGTSPLYAFKECFHPMHGIAATPENVYGVLSLIFWSLMLVVVFKYLSFIMRADNRGEGGIMALMALLTSKSKDGSPSRTRPILILLGLFGAALLYGDGAITPAISVLSAIEGLEIATPAFKPMVVPVTLAILIGIFAVQKRGTARIGSIFGPVTLLWFISIAAIGVPWIIRHPEIIQALNPLLGVEFFWRNGLNGFLVLSAVVLCITGAEALYADMGHFGRGPIRLGWYAIVYPALTLNYFGQGAVVLERGAEAVSNPFYALVDGWMLYPLVALATAAAVIASQAMISGAYSLTQQAVQLGYLPRITIQHTSRSTEGQIYVPRVNQLLMIGCLSLVLVFQGSTPLAAAYGIAVTGTMVTTTILFYAVTRQIWGWSLLASLSLLAVFLTVDLAFFSANVLKVAHGGWVPIVVATLMFTIMTTWRRGADLLDEYASAARLPVEYFLADLDAHPLTRVGGTAVVMDARGSGVPRTLLHNIKHNKVLHERILLLTLRTAEMPHVSPEDRLHIHTYREDFVRVVAHYGYMENPNVSEVLDLAREKGVSCDPQQATYFFGRETLIIGEKKGLATWRKYIYDFLFRNAYGAYLHLGVPPNRVIEIGQQVEI